MPRPEDTDIRYYVKSRSLVSPWSCQCIAKDPPRHLPKSPPGRAVSGPRCHVQAPDFQRQLSTLGSGQPGPAPPAPADLSTPPPCRTRGTAAPCGVIHLSTPPTTPVLYRYTDTVGVWTTPTRFRPHPPTAPGQRSLRRSSTPALSPRGPPDSGSLRPWSLPPLLALPDR